ncbi:ABC transporter substrate-binding protein [Streptosporangium amethystogenes subsp. fukuiense]|uniref:ABC transporter substrate-binding protein n=1 Tax=Streptosporangium amethystogenes subsp. fukuiense TaxID=698418 RepID=A0ABW2SXJ9_9ACTN
MTTSDNKARTRGTRRLATIALSVLLTAGTLTACGGGGETIAADAKTGNRKIRIAAPFISTMNSAILYAQGTGILKKHNIEAEFIEVHGGGSLQATLGGSTDMAITSSVNPMAALQQGQEFPIIAQVGNGFPESVIITASAWKESGLKDDSSLKDKMKFLAGKPWGVSSPQGSSSYMAKYMFQLAGLSADDFKMNSMGSASGTLAGLKSEKVVAGSMGSPYPQVAESEGYAKLFVNVSGGEVPELTNTLTSVVAVTPDFYKNNKELVADFRKALGEAQKEVYENSAVVDEWIYKEKFEGSPKDAVLSGVKDQRDGGAIAKQPEVSEESAERLVAFMKATGQPVPDDWRKIFVDLSAN